MKKILATLLVATMLLSCFTFIGYAAGTVEATAPVYSDANEKSGKYYVLTDPLSAGYYDGVFAIEEDNYEAMLTTSPLFNGLDSMDLSGITQPYTYDVGEYIGFPFYAGEEGSFALDATFTYPTENLAFAGAIGCNDATAEAKVAENRMIAYSNVNVTGAFAIALFKVVATTGGSATITANVTEATYNNAGTPANCTVGNTALTFALNGVATEKDPAAATDISDAVGFTGTSDDYNTDFAAVVGTVTDSEGVVTYSNANVVSGDDVAYDYAKHGVYQIYFANAVADSFKTPDEQGIQFTINDNEPVYKAAQKIVDGKFGILIFGMGSQSTVEAKAYAKYGTEYVLAD